MLKSIAVAGLFALAVTFSAQTEAGVDGLGYGCLGEAPVAGTLRIEERAQPQDPARTQERTNRAEPRKDCALV